MAVPHMPIRWICLGCIEFVSPTMEPLPAKVSISSFKKLGLDSEGDPDPLGFFFSGLLVNCIGLARSNMPGRHAWFVDVSGSGA